MCISGNHGWDSNWNTTPLRDIRYIGELATNYIICFSNSVGKFISHALVGQNYILKFIQLVQLLIITLTWTNFGK